MTNSPTFRENLALAATGYATHLNLCSGDPGITGANEVASARGVIAWTGGAVDGTVQGAELTLTDVPVGSYPYVALFGGLTGANYLTSYPLPSALVVTATGPVKITPQYVHPA